MNNEEIKRLLSAAGIPTEAFRTTLEREGHKAAKAWVASRAGAASTTGSPVAIVALAKRTGKAEHDAAMLLYLMAKEAALSGIKVHCCDLIEYKEAVVDGNDDSLLDAIDSCDMLFLRNFYDGGEPPLSVYDRHYAASRLYRWISRGKGLVVLCNEVESGVVPAVRSWWPSSLCSSIEYKAITLVGGK